MVRSILLLSMILGSQAFAESYSILVPICTKLDDANFCMPKKLQDAMDICKMHVAHTDKFPISYEKGWESCSVISAKWNIAASRWLDASERAQRENQKFNDALAHDLVEEQAK